MRRHRVGALVVPVRVIGREQQHAVRADLLAQLLDAVLVGRGIEWLDCQAEVVADDVGRRAIDPRHLDPHAFPGLVRAPHAGRKPADARFHQHDLQRRELAEHAFEHEAQDLGLHRLRFGEIVFIAVGWPADRRRRVAVGAAGMDRDRQPMLLGCRPHRPVQAPAQCHLALSKYQHGDEPFVGGPPLDFLDGKVRRLQRHDDRGAQALVLGHPFGGDPVVGRLGEGCREIGIIDRVRAVEAVADREIGAETVERLGSAASRSCCRASHLPRRQSGRPESGMLGRIALQVEAVDAPRRDLLFPVIVEIGQQRRATWQRRMDIAVDQHAGHCRFLIPPRACFSGTRPWVTGVAASAGLHRCRSR